MKKIIIIILMIIKFLSLAGINTKKINDVDNKIYELALSNIKKRYPKWYDHKKLANRYTKRIIMNSAKYRLPRWKIARQIWGESRFKNNAKGDYYNTNYNSFGCSQIMLKCHIKRIRKHSKGRLGKYNRKRYINYLYIIENSIDIQCSLMNDLLDKYNDYEVALLGYGCGENSKSFKIYKNYKKIPLKYIRNIMDR